MYGGGFLHFVHWNELIYGCSPHELKLVWWQVHRYLLLQHSWSTQEGLHLPGHMEKEESLKTIFYVERLRYQL